MVVVVILELGLLIRLQIKLSFPALIAKDLVGIAYLGKEGITSLTVLVRGLFVWVVTQSQLSVGRPNLRGRGLSRHSQNFVRIVGIVHCAAVLDPLVFLMMERMKDGMTCCMTNLNDASRNRVLLRVSSNVASTSGQTSHMLSVRCDTKKLAHTSMRPKIRPPWRPNRTTRAVPTSLPSS